MVNYYIFNFRVIYFKKVGGNIIINFQVIVMVNLLYFVNFVKSLEGEIERFSMINEMSFEFV